MSGVAGRGRRIEPASVVADREPDHAAIERELQRHAGGLSVAHGVDHRLPRNPQQLFLDSLGTRTRGAGDIHVKDDVVGDEPATAIAQGVDEAARTRIGRPQVPDRVPHLADVLLDLLAEAHELRLRARIRGGDAVLDRVELQRQSGQTLQQGVVDFAAEAHALGVDGGKIPPHALDAQPPCAAGRRGPARRRTPRRTRTSGRTAARC